MVFAQLGVNVIVGTNRVVADVGRIWTVDPVRAPGFVDALIQRIRGSVRMISAVAPVCYEIAVVLKHVEVVVSNDALDFVLSPLPGFRNAQIDGLSLEGLRLPVL